MGLPQAENGTQRHDQHGKVAMDHDSGLGFLGEASQVPGMLALLENPVLNHRTPVICIKDYERIADRTIGQVDGAKGFRHAIGPSEQDDGMNGLTLVIAPMGVLCLLRIPILITGGQPLDLPYDLDTARLFEGRK